MATTIVPECEISKPLFACARCGKGFADRYLLKKHIIKNKTLCKPKVLDLSKEALIKCFFEAYPGPANEKKYEQPVQAAAEPEPAAAGPEPAAAGPAAESAATEPEPEPAAAVPEPEPAAAVPEPEPAAAVPEPEPAAAKPEPKPAAAVPAAKPEPKPAAAKPEPKPAAAVPAAKPEPEPPAAKPEPEPADASTTFCMDANAQRFVLAKLHALDAKMDKILELLAVAAKMKLAPALMSDDAIVQLHDLFHDMVASFMRWCPDWAWWAVKDVLGSLKTSGPDRTAVLLVTLLRSIATMAPAQDVLIQGVPRRLPAGFPKSLERELAALVRDMRQDYRKDAFYCGDADAWGANQMALSFVEQQLLGKATMPDMRIAFGEAGEGLSQLVTCTAGTEAAWDDVVARLLCKRRADVLRFVQTWPRAGPSTDALVALVHKAVKHG
ncbi:hypothetical protein COO60DRAFT_1463546 [Scenedesmus sp. NREL 46B-D3]|nr:hypothetical protein COO60DRAFT_1463546 [Scenedesmus sp. NREL 46B-D3]